MKRLAIVLVLASGLLGSASVALAFPNVTEGVSGLCIWVFLAYCGLVVVAQLFVALRGVRDLLEEWTSKKKTARRIAVRPE